MRSALPLVLLLASCGPRPSGDSIPACPPGGTDTTWTNHAKPFLDTWCTSCHHSALPVDRRHGAPLGLDYDTWQGTRTHGLRIYERAVRMPATMPPAGGPEGDERSLLGEWIACGMPGGAPTLAEPCSGPRRALSGDLRVAGPEDAAAFCATHDAVSGDLFLDGPGAVELDCLCEVGGSVVVPASSTATMVALDWLQAVGGGLAVEGAPALREVSLAQLKTVGGGIQVVGNPALLSLDLGELEEAAGGLQVEDNPLLGEVLLNRLYACGGDLRLVGNLSASSIGLDRILTVVGDLVVEGNTGLRSLLGDAYQLEFVGGDLIVRGHPQLEGFYGFIELVDIGGSLRIEDNDSFESFYGFTRLETVGGDLQIAGHARLGLVDGFDFLDWVGGELALEDNAVMRFVDGFRVLDQVNGEVRLARLPQLDSVGGLDDLRTVGALRIDQTGLDTLTSLRDITVIAGDLVVTDNPSLPAGEVDSLVGVVGMENIGGYVVNSGNGG